MVSYYVRGYPPLDGLRLLSLLWNPLFNTWFLYALALAFLVAWCLRRAPAWAVLAGRSPLLLQRRNRPLFAACRSSSASCACSRCSGSG